MNTTQKAEYHKGWAILQSALTEAQAELSAQVKRENEAAGYRNMAANRLHEVKRKIETCTLDQIPGLVQQKAQAEAEIAAYDVRAQHEASETQKCLDVVAKCRHAADVYNRDWADRMSQQEWEQAAVRGDVIVSQTPAGIMAYHQR